MKLKDLTILFVEDDYETQKIVSAILKPHLKHIHLACNGIEGFDIYNNYKPDIIITDLEMPFMDGVEMSKKIKQNNKNQPIILFTAYNDTDTLNYTKTVEFSRCFFKPLFDFEELIEALQTLIESN